MDFNDPSNPISPMNPASPFYVGRLPTTTVGTNDEYSAYKPVEPTDPFTTMLVILGIGVLAVAWVFLRVKS